MTDPDSLPEWAPRVPQWKICRLYENNAVGLYDDELIDDVAYTLFARCRSFITACEATVRLPRAGHRVRAAHGLSRMAGTRVNC